MMFPLSRSSRRGILLSRIIMIGSSTTSKCVTTGSNSNTSRSLSMWHGLSTTYALIPPIRSGMFGLPNRSQVRRMSALSSHKCLEGTSLGENPVAQKLLEGLTVHTVPANGDEHPLAVYSYANSNETGSNNDFCNERRPILLLHGRTWSSVPVYHLKNRSIMESFYEMGLEPYAVDFRGFGGTLKDKTGTF